MSLNVWHPSLASLGISSSLLQLLYTATDFREATKMEAVRPQPRSHWPLALNSQWPQVPRPIQFQEGEGNSLSLGGRRGHTHSGCVELSAVAFVGEQKCSNTFSKSGSGFIVCCPPCEFVCHRSRGMWLPLKAGWSLLISVLFLFYVSTFGKQFNF